MDLYIKKAILHAFDPGQPEITFSENLMELTPVMLDYVTKKSRKKSILMMPNVAF